MNADRLDLNQTSVSNLYFGNGAKGDITLHAKSISMKGVSITSQKGGGNDRPAGAIVLSATPGSKCRMQKVLQQLDVGKRGGKITIDAPTMKMSGGYAHTLNQAAARKGGDVSFIATDLSFCSQANVKTLSDTAGETGSITLTVERLARIGDQTEITTASAADKSGGISVQMPNGSLVLSDRSLLRRQHQRFRRRIPEGSGQSHYRIFCAKFFLARSTSRLVSPTSAGTLAELPAMCFRRTIYCVLRVLLVFPAAIRTAS